MRESLRRVWVYAIVAVLLLDTIASIASRVVGFSYASLSPLSFTIYAVAGFAAGRLVGLVAAAYTGALVALVEATLGWAISWLIGPGQPPATLGAAEIVAIILTVVITGAIFGLLGGLLGRWRARRVAS